MTQEEHLEYSHHSSSNSVHDQVNDDTTKSKNITTATSNQAMVVDPTTTSCRDAQTDKLSQSDSNRRLNDKQQLIDNNNECKNVSGNNNNIKDKPTSECLNKTVNNQSSDINENNKNINNNKQIENLTKTFNSDIVTDSNKDCSKISEENNRRKYFNSSRQSTFDRSVSLDIEDPIERLNKLKSNITDVLKEVKAVLDKHSEPEQEKEENIKPLDDKVVRFRFIRRVRKKTSFDLEDEQARKNILKEEEELGLKNTEDQNKMGIQNSFVISSEEHTNVIDKKLDIEGHKSDISEFNEDNDRWIQDNQLNESSKSELLNQSSNINADTIHKSVAITEEKIDDIKLNQLEDLNKQNEPQLISAQASKITTLIKQSAIDESIPASTLKTDNDKLVKIEDIIVNKTDSIESISVINDKSVEEKPKKKIVKKTISSSSKDKIDTNNNKSKDSENKIKTKLISSTNKINSAAKAEKSEKEIVKILNKTNSCESQENNKSEVKEVSQTSQVITPSATDSIPGKTSAKTSVSDPLKSKIVDENKSEIINKVSAPVKINKSSTSVEQTDKSNKTDPIKTTGENLKVEKEVNKEVEKELKKELEKEVTKPIVNQKTTTEMPPQSTDSLTKNEIPAEDVVKKKIVKKIIKPAADTSNDVKAAVKTAKEVRKGSITSSDVQKLTSASSSESPSVKEEPTEDKIKKKVVKKITKSTAKDLSVEASTPSDNNKKVEESVNKVEFSNNQPKSSTIDTSLTEDIPAEKAKKKVIKKSVNDNDKNVTKKIVKSDQIKPTEPNKTVDSSVKSAELKAEIISNATAPTTASSSSTTTSSADKNLSSSIKNSNLIETNQTINDIKTDNQRSTVTKDNNESVVPIKTTSHIPIPAKTVVPAPLKDVPVSKKEMESVSAKEDIPIPSKDPTTEPAKEVADVPKSKISTPSISQKSAKPELNETKDENHIKVTKEVKSESAAAPKLTVTAPKKELKEEKNLKLSTELKPDEKKLIRRRPSAPEQLESTKTLEKVILRRRPSSLLPNSLSTVQKSVSTSEEKTLVRRRPSSLVLDSTEQKDETTKQPRRRPSSLLSNSTILEQNAIKVEPIAAKPSESKSKEEIIDNKSLNSLPVPSSESSSSSFPQVETKTSPISSPISPTSKSFGISALDKVLATTNFKPITDKKVVSQIIVKPPMSMMLQSQKSIDKLGFESTTTTTKPTTVSVPQEIQQVKTSNTSTPVTESITSMKQISEKDLTANHKKVPSNSTNNALTTSIPKEVVDSKSITSNKIVPTTSADKVEISPIIQKTIEQKIPSATTLDISDNKTLKNKKVEQPPTKPDEISSVQQPSVKNDIKIKQDDDKIQEDAVITSKKSSISLDKLIGKIQQIDDKNNKQTNQHDAAHIPNDKEADTKKESATKAEKIKTNDVSGNNQQKSTTESTNNKVPTKVSSEKTPKLTPKTPLKIEKNSVMAVAVKPKLTLLPAPSKAVQLVSTKLEVIPVQKPSVVKTVEIKKPTPQTPVVEHKTQEASANTAKAAIEQVAEQTSSSSVIVQPITKVELEEVDQSCATPSTEVAAPSTKTVVPSIALPEALGSSPSSTEPSATPSEISDTSLEPQAAPSETTDATEDQPKPDDAASLPPKKPKKKKSKKKIIKVVIKRIKRKLSKDDTPIVEVEPEICEKEIEPDEPDSEEEEEEEPEPAGPTKPKSCLKLREYEPGDIVMYADRIRKMVKWKKATVLERITSISYKLDVNGEEKSAHICYIKKYTDKKVQFGGKEYLEIDYAQLEAEEDEPEYNIWARV